MFKLTKEDLLAANHERRNFRNEEAFEFYLNTSSVLIFHFSSMIQGAKYIKLNQGNEYCIDIFSRSIQRICND